MMNDFLSLTSASAALIAAVEAATEAGTHHWEAGETKTGAEAMLVRSDTREPVLGLVERSGHDLVLVDVYGEAALLARLGA